MFVFVKIKEKTKYTLMESLLQYLHNTIFWILYPGSHDNKFKSSSTEFQWCHKRCKYSESSSTTTFFVQDMECIIMLLGKFWLLNHVS